MARGTEIGINSETIGCREERQASLIQVTRRGGIGLIESFKMTKGRDLQNQVE